MIIKHEGIRCPSKKFNSCIEGRIFALFDYFLNDPEREMEFYYLLAPCSLKYERCFNVKDLDPWYFQPIRILFSNLYDISSREGFRTLQKFMRKYGIECAI